MRILANTWLRKYISGRIRILKLLKEMKKNKNAKVFLFCTPLSSNLGDHAITLAERYFFETYFKEKNICEVPLLFTDELLKTIKRNISSKDLIAINGGGFMGDVWFFEESMIRNVVSEFPDNNIVIFPQTINYTYTENGQAEFENSKKLYSLHKNLYIFAREKISYEIMKNAYLNCEISLCPDIVLFGGFKIKSYERKDILLCLRSDKESKLADSFKEKINQELSALEENTIRVDTVIDRYVSINEREKYVIEKLDEFAKSKLVITDRLHGMIFCALTGTPCIVFSNNNHKVKGVYDWIKNLKYIYFMENANDLRSAANNLLNCEAQHYDETLLRAEYRPLVDLIKIL